jgi:hypothetical protein
MYKSDSKMLNGIEISMAYDGVLDMVIASRHLGRRIGWKLRTGHIKEADSHEMALCSWYVL